MEIEFIEGPNGRTIPVQKIRTVYVLPGGPPLMKLTDLASFKLHVEDPAGGYYVSHFETCPEPERFTKRKRS